MRELTLCENWHPNGHCFCEEKKGFFNNFDQEAAGIINAPEYAFHMPRRAIVTWRLGQFVVYDYYDDYYYDDLMTRLLSTCRHAASYLLGSNKGICFPPFHPHQIITSLYPDYTRNVCVLQFGPDPIRHSLIPGDTVIIHNRTGFSLMPDGTRWSREFVDMLKKGPSKCCVHEDPQPFMGIFVGYKEQIDDDGDQITNYTLLIDNGEIVSFTPFDVVKNVRVSLMERSASIIQRHWRCWKTRGGRVLKTKTPFVGPTPFAYVDAPKLIAVCVGLLETVCMQRIFVHFGTGFEQNNCGLRPLTV